MRAEEALRMSPALRMSEIDSEAFRAWIEDRFGATDSQLRDWAFAYDDVLAAWNARALLDGGDRAR